MDITNETILERARELAKLHSQDFDADPRTVPEVMIELPAALVVISALLNRSVRDILATFVGAGGTTVQGIANRLRSEMENQ